MNSPSVSTFSPGQLVRWSADPLGSWRSLMVCEHDGWSSDTAIVSPVGQYYIPDNDEIFMVVREFGTFPEHTGNVMLAWSVFMIGEQFVVGREIDFKPVE